jgi:hypothetical protein
VHDAVPDRLDAFEMAGRGQPVGQRLRGARQVAGGQRLLARRPVRVIVERKRGVVLADAIDLALETARQPVVQRMDGEADAGRAAVDGQDGVGRSCRVDGRRVR